MRILVAGARSELGSRTAAVLRTDGHDVVGLTRGPAAAGFVTADVLDADATRRAVAEVAPEVIVQTLNALPEKGPRRAKDMAATNLLRIEGTRNIVDAAVKSGVRRIVAESFLMAYSGTPVGGPPATEESAAGAKTGNAGVDTAIDALMELERQVLGFGGIVMRCGLFYGSELGSSKFMAGLVRRRMLPVVAGADNVMSYIHIDDAAAAMAAAVTHGRPGNVYNVVDDEPATAADYVGELAAALGSPPPRAVPRWLFRLAAGRYLAAVVSINLALSNAKAKEQLGWTPAYPTIRDGLRTTAGQSAAQLPRGGPISSTGDRPQARP
jgi:nucleoside-diphosphate-sugar epimerase